MEKSRNPDKGDLSEMIKERNQKLDSFLSKYLPGSHWIGDINTPAIILGKKVLSCYVKNFTLILLDKPKEGSELFRYRLDRELEDDEKYTINVWKSSEESHKEIFRIKVSGIKLYLSGYNFKDRSDPKEPKDRYPVFAPFSGKIYFTESVAQDIIDSYNHLVPLEIE